MNEKHIEPITIESLYETGIPEWYVSNGLRFHWYSWLLCELSNRHGNPRHHVICTNFRSDNFRKIGAAINPFVTRWNPSYEDDEHKPHVKLSSLHYWKPISIVKLDH